MAKSPSIVRKLIDACTRRGITQQSAFQSFVTGGVTALAGVGTLLMMESSTAVQHEILALIAAIVAGLGLVTAGASYLLLLILRLGQPASSSRDDSE